MADKSKAEKLAAARKKLKQFQQKSNPVHKTPDLMRESASSSTQVQELAHDISIQTNNDPSYSGKSSVYANAQAPTQDCNMLPQGINSIKSYFDTEYTDLPASLNANSFIQNVPQPHSVNTYNYNDINQSSHQDQYYIPDNNELISLAENIRQENIVNSNTMHNSETVDQVLTAGWHEITEKTINVENVRQNLSNQNQLVSDVSGESMSSISHVDFIPNAPQFENEYSYGPNDRVNNQDNVYISGQEHARQEISFDIAKAEQSTPESHEISDKTINLENVAQDFFNQKHLESSVFEESLQPISNVELIQQLSAQVENLIAFDEQPVKQVKYDNELELWCKELAQLLENEKMKSEQLRLQNDHNMTEINSLRNELHISKNEKVSKTEEDVDSMLKKLQYHQQTFEILVGEKNELSSLVNQTQLMLQEKSDECQELSGRLKAARHRGNDLERELSTLKAITEKHNRTHEDAFKELEKYKNDIATMKKSNEDIVDESSELKEKLNAKANECIKLKNELQEKLVELSISQLKIQQLSTEDTQTTDVQVEVLTNENKILQSKISELENTIKKISQDRDQISQQYQQYFEQLNAQVQSIAGKLQETTQENEKLSSREKDLVQHISQLEKQLQIGPKKREAPPLVALNNNELDEIKEKCTRLEIKCTDLQASLEQATSSHQLLQQQLEASNVHVKDLEESLETLQTDSPDAVALSAAIESDKLAASRATAQNQQLKQQLEELQKGFVQMSDYKLEITEKLYAEQHLGRELNSMVGKLEEEVKSLRTTLSAKDEEMIRLQHESTELEKQVLQQSQLTDRLRHYEAKGQISEMLQKDLEQAREQIKNLAVRNSELETTAGEIVKNGTATERNNSAPDETVPDGYKSDEAMQNAEPKTNVADNTTVIIPTDEAMGKLQERFTRTMDEIAELSEEKQRLEHLVLQLQSETETIGEYIALYQTQRIMLKQREHEKDTQLQRLAMDREDMKNKLVQLNKLVEQLLVERNNRTNVQLLQHDYSHNETDNNNRVLENIPEIHNYAKDHIDHFRVEEGREVSEDTPLNESLEHFQKPKTTETAQKIIALLSEIKESNLVHPKQEDGWMGVHHCHCCSGKLLTV